MSEIEPARGEDPGILPGPGEGQGAPAFEDLKPSELVGFSLKPESRELIEELENLDRSLLEKGGYKSLPEYLTTQIIKLTSLELPSGRPIDASPHGADFDIYHHLRIVEFNELVVKNLLLRWGKKGLI